MSTVTERVPKIVAEFDFEDVTYWVVWWPDEDGEWGFETYRADMPWHWKSQPYEDVRL